MCCSAVVLDMAYPRPWLHRLGALQLFSKAVRSYVLVVDGLGAYLEHSLSSEVREAKAGPVLLLLQMQLVEGRSFMVSIRFSFPRAGAGLAVPIVCSRRCLACLACLAGLAIVSGTQAGHSGGSTSPRPNAK